MNSSITLAGLRSLLLAFTLGTSLSSLPAATPARPNIMVILTDDMGYSDLGCFGGEIQTPNLDHLAANGLRFTQFYNTARCCPTRASLLTGLHPHQAGIGHMVDTKHREDGYLGNLNRSCVTIAEALKPAGYRAYMCGKWHVAKQIGLTDPPDTWPMQRGFDKFYGTLTGAGSYYDPGTLCRSNTFITPENDPEYHPQKFYYTDAIADNVVNYLRSHQREQPGQPFFFYVAFTAAHWPMHALPEDIAKYQGKYDGGYEPVRLARYAREQQLGLIDRNWPLSPQSGNWAAITNWAWEARCMEVYAAMVDRMDQGVGRIVAELKRSGQLDNTVILYLQDNGACAETVGRQAATRKKAAAAAAIAYRPLGPNELQTKNHPPMQTRDGRPLRTGVGVMPGPEDTYVAYGQAWANVSNTPFREYKHWTHEGGIATPLIAHWPAGIPAARRNKLVAEPGQLPDIMATCLDLAGAAYPTQYNGQAITPLEGKSLAPAFAGKPVKRDGLFWEHEGNRAVRVGQWKLVAKGPRGPWELYNLAKDRTELNNLAAKQPKRVAELAAKWQVWAQRARVLPWPWNEKAADKNISAKTRFELGPEADLARGESPDYVDRGFAVTVQLETPGRDGVLAAQGGRAQGWTLYFQKGVLHFVLNRNSEREDFACTNAAVATAKTIIATVSAEAQVTVTADGREVLRETAEGLPTAVPVEGLQVGRDLGAPVGDYEVPFAFTGKITRVLLELQPRH